MLTSSATALRLLLTEADRRGVDMSDVLGEAALDPAQLEDPTARIDDDTQRVVVMRLLERIDDPTLGLAVTRDLPPGTFGSLGYTFRNSDTLLDSLRRVERFARLLNEAAQVELSVGPERGRFVVRIDDPLPLPRSAVRLRAQIWLSTLVRLGRKITATHFQPLLVAFPYTQPDDLTAYRELFDCELRFGAAHPAIELSRATLELPVVNPDRNLARVMERYSAGLLERLPDSSDIELRVRQATCRAVEAGEPRLEQVARELGMSARSLQRKLQAAEISFSSVLDEVRRELALAYLEEPHLSVDQVASVLGFASGSSFAKAFRRWTGSAPGTYRGTSNA